MRSAEFPPAFRIPHSALESGGFLLQIEERLETSDEVLALIREGAIHEVSGGTVDISSAGIPPSLRLTILRGLSSISADVLEILEPGFVHIDGDNSCAFAREPGGQGPADPARRARDDNDSTFQHRAPP